MITEGVSTGSNPTKTGERIKAFLSKRDKDLKDSPITRKVTKDRAIALGTKLGNRVERKGAGSTKYHKANQGKWAKTDYMKAMVDWTERLGNLILEGSLSSNRVLRKLAKAAKTRDHDDAFNSYSKWHKKRMIRTNKPSYKKHTFGEKE